MGTFVIRILFEVLVIRVPYYIGNPKRDLNLENYPNGLEAATGNSLTEYFAHQAKRCNPYVSQPRPILLVLKLHVDPT